MKRKQTKPSQGLGGLVCQHMQIFQHPQGMPVRLRGLDRGPTQEALPVVGGGGTWTDAIAHQWVPLTGPSGQRRLSLPTVSDLSL